MEHKSEFYKSFGSENPKTKNGYKVKMKCNGCGFISSETTICPNNDGTMHKYINPFPGSKLKH